MDRRHRQKKAVSVWGMASVLILTLVLLGMIVYPNDRKNTEPEKVILKLEDQILVQTSDPERLREIKDLLSGAEQIGYEPKTYILGADLVYTDEAGKAVALELDLDGDLFRYEGIFYDYGPGNDNNAMPQLLNLLGLEGWPEEVKAAHSAYFAAVEEQAVPTNGTYRQQAVYMDLWYPDWYYVKMQEAHALAILDALRQENPVQTDRKKPAVEECVFTIHIAYDDGREYDLAYIGEDTFLLWEGGKETVYGFTSIAFRDTAQEMIARSKESAQ